VERTLSAAAGVEAAASPDDRTPARALRTTWSATADKPKAIDAAQPDAAQADALHHEAMLMMLSSW